MEDFKTKDRLKNVWYCMKRRCNNPEHPKYHRYGGRGIKVCDEWGNSFDKFAKWALQNGYSKGLEIDRIDNDGDYEPNNCRFVTHKENMRNTSTNVFVEYDGELTTLAELCEKTGVNRAKVAARMKKGYPLEVAISDADFHGKSKNGPLIFRLEEIRNGIGMTETALSAKSGVPKVVIRDMENGSPYGVTAGTIMAIASALGVRPGELFY